MKNITITFSPDTFDTLINCLSKHLQCKEDYERTSELINSIQIQFEELNASTLEKESSSIIQLASASPKITVNKISEIKGEESLPIPSASSTPSNNPIASLCNKKAYRGRRTPEERRAAKMQRGTITRPIVNVDSVCSRLERRKKRVQRWKNSTEGKYLRNNCLKEYYETLQQIEKRNN